MKDTGQIKTRKWSWVSTIILVLIFAFAAGCTHADDDGQASPPEDDMLGYMYGSAEEDADLDATDENLDDEDQGDDGEDALINFDDFGMIVATVNGIEIPASAVMDEIGWVLHSLMQEYVMMFPQDEEFNYGHTFRGDSTFGRVVLEEAAYMAAHVALYYDFATRQGIEWDEWSQELHPVIQIVYAIVGDPDMFEAFEQYIPEDIVDKAEALLERALAGEDFAALVEAYGEDPGMDMYPTGYTFVSGDMVAPFEEATMELEIGEISDLVITNFGIHIIMRVEPDPENIMSQSRAEPDVAEEDLLGAKHILIMGEVQTLEDRMFDAVFYAFQAKLEAANIEFLPALDDIPLE